MSQKKIYLIPGRGESLEEGLGDLILNLGYGFQGRELAGEFEGLRFSQQLDIIKSDLAAWFWHSKAVLIGRSYGAYLLLHSLAEMGDFPGATLLFSPVLGAALALDGFFGSIPPRAQKLLQMAEDHNFPAFRHMEIHTGLEDKGCDPALAEKFASGVKKAELYLIPGMGHHLDEKYVYGVLSRFFSVRPFE